MTAQIKTNGIIVNFNLAQSAYEQNTIDIQVDDNVWTNLEVGYTGADLFVSGGNVYVEYDPTGDAKDFVELEFPFDSLDAETKATVLEMIQK